jgi:hypothetical protein
VIMKTFCTNFFALDLTDGTTKKFQGQNIVANNWDEAETICEKNFPYLEIEGELQMELDFITLKEINLSLN